jgi:ABC-type multidrug transport system permease subunit
VVLQAAIAGLARRVREEQLTGTLETLLAQPITAVDLAFGLAGFPFLFAVVRAFAYLLLAGAFLGLSFAHTDWLGLIVSFAVSGFAFAGIGIILAALVVVFKRAESLASFGTVALSLLGGAVFPISALPDWLQPLATIVPTRFAFNAVRRALFGSGDWLDPTLVLLGIGAALMALSLVLFAAALRLVVRQGTVSQY